MDIKKLLALVLAAACILSFTACGDKEMVVDSQEEGSTLGMEDGEDIEIVKAKATIANVSGKDAVSLLARKSGTSEWSDNVLSQDYLHADMAVELSYNESDNNVYDLRLVFEDGTYQDFTNIDLSSGQPVYYLGRSE